jgi:hypothetical protein
MLDFQEDMRKLFSYKLRHNSSILLYSDMEGRLEIHLKNSLIELR